jgi:5-methylcytosine-specific restriction endonuclease McrA
MSRVAASLREKVRERANERCEYCRKPEGIGNFGHHIDHIIALKHNGSSDIENLAWACFQCNTTKGSNVASYDVQTKALTPLFKPPPALMGYPFSDISEWFY